MSDSSLARRSPEAQRVLPEKSGGQLQAHLRKADSEDLWLELGGCLEFARRSVGWTLDQLAAELPPAKEGGKRDPRQVRRWEAGEEMTPLAVVFAVEALRKPFVVALAKLAACEIETTVRIRAWTTLEHKARRYQQIAQIERELSIKGQAVRDCTAHLKELKDECEGILSKLRAAARDEGELPLLDMMEELTATSGKAS